MGDTGNPLSLFFVHFNSAFEIRVVDFTMAENKSSALMFISFDTYMKYVKGKKSQSDRTQLNLAFLNT